MYAVHQLYFLVQKHLEKELTKAKTISFSQFFIVMCFLECLKKGEHSQSNVAKYLHLTEATVSRHIARLVEKGIIRRVAVSPQKRSFIIQMTPKGSREFAKARFLIDRELSSLFSVIKSSNRKNIIDNFDAVLAPLLKK